MKASELRTRAKAFVLHTISVCDETDTRKGESLRMLHTMKLLPKPFTMIKSGKKTIELRLFDEKRQMIKVGDDIVFMNTETGEMLTKSVVKLHQFNSFEEMYKALPLLRCGYTAEDIDKAHPSDMQQYYSVEEQKKYGVVRIELC